MTTYLFAKSSPTVYELTEWCKQNLLSDSWSSFYEKYDEVMKNWPEDKSLTSFHQETAIGFTFKHHRYYFYFNDEESFVQFKLAWD